MQIQLRAKLYGPLALVADASVALELPEGATVAQLIEELDSRYGGRLKEHIVGATTEQLLVACIVNQRFAGLKTVLHEGDEVALLPSTAGG